MTLDRMMYLVISDLDGPIILEVELHRMSFSEVMKDIREGQYRDVLAVLEINPVEGICKEVTHEFREVIDRRPDDD